MTRGRKCVLRCTLLLWAVVAGLWLWRMTAPVVRAVQTPKPSCMAEGAVAYPTAPETTPEPTPDEALPEPDAIYLAQCLWGEARGVQSETEQAAVVWCVLNRVDHPGFPDTIYGVLAAPNQFIGFSESHPVDPALLALAQDVLARWRAEQTGEADSGRVLPQDYLWFSADGHGHNAFRNAFRQGTTWRWTAESPYTT